MKDTRENAISAFQGWYGPKFTEFACIPDPQVNHVWLVVGKQELKTKIRLLGAIIYLDKNDTEEISALESLKNYPNGLMEVQDWIDEAGKKKIIDEASF